MSGPPFPCPCCGYPTLSEAPPGTNAICPVCYWEDDQVGFDVPSFPGGANQISLEDARANFEATGVSDERMRKEVRAPTENERKNRVRPV